MTRWHYQALLTMAAIATLGIVVFSVSIGSTSTGISDLIAALLQYDATVDAHLAIRDIRLPRAILALLVGASLAAAGAVMQGVTRNPLASPSIMGLSGGASLTSLVAIILWPTLSYNGSIFASLAGAGLGYGCVLVVTMLSPDGFTPTRVALAGAVTSALFAAITQGLVISLGMSSTMLYWTIGGIANVTWAQVLAVLPFSAVGLVGLWWLAADITILSLGRDVAVGLGQRSAVVRVGATLLVLLLTGAAVAVAGPVSFIGLMVPHACRLMAGADYRRLLPASMIIGAGATALADLAARTLLGNRGEMPLGVITAAIGAPFFLWLLRGRRQQRLDDTTPIHAAARGHWPARWVFGTLGGVLCSLMLFALYQGDAEISADAILRTLVGRGSADENLILWTFRIPRLAFAMLVGMGIAVAGAILQGVLRNDLAEPGILGVSAGASFAIVVVFAFLGPAALRSVFVLPVAGVCGAMASMILVYSLCLDGQHSSPRLLLTGVAVSSVAGATTLLLSLQISSDMYAFVVAFGAGSLNAASWNYVAVLGGVLALLVPLAWSFAPALNVLRLGTDSATGLGVNVPRWSLGLLTLGVAICAVSMSLAGGIVFLGLIAPHIARRLVGSDHSASLPAAAFLGAILLLLADLLGRNILPQVEIPAGVMVSALGSPYFLYLLARR